MFGKSKDKDSKTVPVVEKKKRDKQHLQPSAPQTLLKTSERYKQEHKAGFNLNNSTTESKRKDLIK